MPTCSSQASHGGNNIGRGDKPEPTHRDVTIMPRLPPQFTQNPEKFTQLRFPDCLSASLSFPLFVSYVVCLTGCQTTSPVEYVRYNTV